MPKALNEYYQGWSGIFGFIPTEREDMWRYYYNYYLNIHRDRDANLMQVITAIDDLDLWKNTVVIMTSDHGEMGGAHGGLRGKGPMVYEENTHVPLIIAHPQAPKGTSCIALTSHIDLLPTLVGLTGIPVQERQPLTANMVGKDFSALIFQPKKAGIHAVRDAILFNYVGLSTVNSSYLEFLFMPVKARGTLDRIDLSKRGFLSLVFDGRYKYARYYAPNDFNTPTTIDEIFAHNDVQLFDLQNDPDELHNLALDPIKNKLLIQRMNEKLNILMSKEVGKNDGRFLPEAVRPQL